jgi:hypothetical protein
LDNDIKKLQDKQTVSTDVFLESTIEYQRRLIPLWDTENVIAGIFFMKV